jgi:predicted metal-dependent peptidase
MAEFDNKTREIVQRLQAIRVKMLREQPFYAVLLMHLRFALDEATPTLYTDGERIAFNPYFVDELDDFQLQFVLMHEILHVALGHCTSEEKDFNHLAYNIACDIVVNSNIMYSLGLIKEKVDIRGGKTIGYEVKKEVEIDGVPLMHKTPDGREGVELNAKEVYALLLKAYPELAKEDEQKQENRDKSNQESSNKKSNKGKAQGGKTQGVSDKTSDDNSDEANNKSNQSNKSNTSGKENSSDEGEAKGESDDEGADSETNGDNGETEGADSTNDKNDDSNDAGGENGDADSGSAGDGDCSNMDGDTASNTASGGGGFADGELGELDDRDQDGEGNSDPIYSNAPCNSKPFNEFDDHSFWDVSDELSNEQKEENEIWTTRMVDATEIAEQISIEFGSTGRGLTPLAAERVIKELKEVQTDWRTVLENFIQEEINDYSFSPPDRRFEDSPFFLPDFNEKDERVEDILFMIDTSGSMSDEQITTAYSEIKGAIDQFDGKLKGWLGFFDAVVVKPQEFENEDEFKIIRPAGGGGTSFDIIFEYVQNEMIDKPPASIIILTDGYAPFPDEKEAMGIPVLWIINNEDVQPPWGKVTRIKD